MNGGTSSSGRVPTVAVLGAYWISSITSLRYTTAPGDVPTLRPTSNALSSVIEIVPLPRSATKFSMPSRRLSPRDSRSFSWASGFVDRKFAGDRASTHCWVKKRIRSRVFASPSTASAILRMNSAFSRYSAALQAYGACRVQAGEEKRLSPNAGNGRSGDMNSVHICCSRCA